MKSKNTLLLLFLLLGINNAFSQFTPQKPDLRLCGSPPNYYEDYFNCTSNNYTLDHVFLSLTNVNGVPLSNTTCTPGTSQEMYVMLNYTSNSNSIITQVRIFADLSIDGNIIPLNVYLPNGVNPGAGQRQIYGPFTWTCGQELRLCRILAVWKTSGSASDPELASYNCNTYNKSQCEFGGCMVVAAPLAVEFDYTVCTNGNQSTVTFNDETSGGIAPYSYSWNFGDGSPVSTQQNPTHNFPYPGGPYTVTLTVTDSNLPNHLVSTYTQVINPPAPITISGDVNAASCSSNNNGSIDITVSGGTPAYTYSWSNGATTQDISGLSPGSYTVTVTDTFGCVKSETFVIGSGDVSNPVVTAPNDLSLEGCGTAAIASQGYLAFSTTPVVITLAQFNAAGGTYTDASPIASITYQDVASGSCPTVVTRTFTLTDLCGNTGTDTQIISIDDTQAPVIDPLPAPTTIVCPAVPQFAPATATDACDSSVTLTYEDVTTPGDCIRSYTTVRTWTATDDCGNSSTATQTITVIDNVPPVAPAPPADVTVSCGSLVPAMISLTANDACCGDLTVPGVDTITPGQCANSYVITRTWTFVDACGNTSSVSQTITVNDNVPPVVPTPPANVTVSCGSQIPAMISLTANDACSGTITVPGVDAVTPGQCINSYVVTRTWTFVDACGNTSSVSQIITVNDNIAPVVPTPPANVTVSCGSQIPAMVTLTANDACGGPITVPGVDSITPGQCNNSYIVTRTWTFVDACGNTSSVSQTITVNDNIPPVAPSAPANITVSCSSLVPTAAVLTANDNCGGSVTGVPNDVVTPGSCPNSYVIVRTWTFTDSCGNSSTASQTITVNDNIPPVAPSAPANITISCSSLVPTAAVLTANDNCGGSVTGVPNDVVIPGSCPNSYTILRTWTFTDSCGNSSTASQTITVNDNIPPVAPPAPANITVSCSSLVPTAAVLT
ncbi:PKD domain-containing protein, partial [Flavobacterium suncheonense]